MSLGVCGRGSGVSLGVCGRGVDEPWGCELRGGEPFRSCGGEGIGLQVASWVVWGEGHWWLEVGPGESVALAESGRCCCCSPRRSFSWSSLSDVEGAVGLECCWWAYGEGMAELVERWVE